MYLRALFIIVICFLEENKFEFLRVQILTCFESRISFASAFFLLI